MTLGQRVIKMRKKMGLTQQQLGQKISVNQSTIQRIEKGTHKGSTHIVELAKALDVTPEWLLGKDENSKDNFDDNKNNFALLAQRIAVLETRLNSFELNRTAY